jgi:hypothetical protein
MTYRTTKANVEGIFTRWVGAVGGRLATWYGDDGGFDLSWEYGGVVAIFRHVETHGGVIRVAGFESKRAAWDSMHFAIESLWQKESDWSGKTEPTERPTNAD